ncbi:transposase [Nocardia sp. NPDC050710]|uniref:transposase n=1 Tax=Nocardia sp. NPDC050710 TaxID=3157220 RepID=UPI0033D4BE28
MPRGRGRRTAGAARFRSSAAFAMHAGTAPIPVWTGNRTRLGLNRGGNRQLNAALHRIAVTQLRTHPPARALVERRTARGSSKTEALRVLKRHLADVVYHRLQQTKPHTTCHEAAAWSVHPGPRAAGRGSRRRPTPSTAATHPG